MALFNLGKKNEKEPTCACNAPAEEVKTESCCYAGAGFVLGEMDGSGVVCALYL